MTARAIKTALRLMLGLVAVGKIAAADSGNATLRFLEARVAADPLDMISFNRLSSECI